MTYTVALVDFPGLPDSARKLAEERYRRALESKLGGAENVPYYFRAWTNVCESDANAVSKPEREAAGAYMVYRDFPQSQACAFQNNPPDDGIPCCRRARSDLN